MNSSGKSITVAIPCFNEAATIQKVVGDFKKELPTARIVVFDNNSTDESADLARAADVEVVTVKRQGKGNVIKKIFDTIESEVLVLVDGDDTYYASDAKKLIEPLMNNKAEIVVGNRFSGERINGMSKSHGIGNKMICFFLNIFFKTTFKDVLSGFRALSKDFYKNNSFFADGFETETEMTLKALEKKYSILETPIQYKNRPNGSNSKVREFRDGSKIIFTILLLFRDYKPMSFFPLLGLFFAIAGLAFGSRVIFEYLQTGLVLRIPTAMLSITLIILGFNSVLAGLIVSATNSRNEELEQILKKIKKN